ncbi:ribosome silencing factor [Acetatifactor muris]|jgi:ribosome-associated protein|uniref:Ribosomal silencing factor RsfS n=1 Tax=Acetatifactor muris TaxID=879566 RepID=A0A2K4ZJI7_9FIRM|nr:ribosome silencing factor [Acetatifactor muris]MCI8798231.1 ribosome silencing factor [Lachnospiraceae bacterium]MCR2048917.1 ribosome silencing factor [Acetatifactor muris]SOY30625.1 Ribosomal silencing factor RsfS [Acetatifactor muris]
MEKQKAAEENRNSKKMARLAIQALEDKKAEDIRVIDISEVSVIADYFIIAGGANKNQIQALCDNVLETLGRAGYPEKQTEGYKTANWILMDFGDVIVHVFDRENRFLYDLERIWRDGKQIDTDEFKG